MSQKCFYLLLLFGASFIFLGHYIITGQAVYGDGIGYYSQVRSWVIDRNWDTTNEYKHLYTPQNNNVVIPQIADSVFIVQTDSQGKALNYFSPGTSLFWLPPYWLTHQAILSLRQLGLPISASGYGNPYQISLGIFSISFLIYSIYLLEKILTFYGVKTWVARLSLFSAYFGTFLIYYGAFDVLNSHWLSFSLSVIFFWLLLQRIKGQSSWQIYLALGLILGLIANVRIQDGSVILIWLIAELFFVPKTLQKSHFSHLMLTILICIALASITPLRWVQLFGTLSDQTYLHGLTANFPGWLQLNIFGSLFNMQTGLFGRFFLLWLSAGYGLWLIYKHKLPSLLWLMVIYWLIQFTIITIQGGWIAQAYGGRMYLSVLPLFILCWGLFLSKIQQLYKTTAVWGIAMICVIMNCINLGWFLTYEKNTENGTAGRETRTIQRLEQIKQNLIFPQSL